MYLCIVTGILLHCFTQLRSDEFVLGLCFVDGHSVENFDADEKTSLLKTDLGSVQHTPSFHSLPAMAGPSKQESRPASVVHSPMEEITEDGQ